MSVPPSKIKYLGYDGTEVTLRFSSKVSKKPDYIVKGGNDGDTHLFFKNRSSLPIHQAPQSSPTSDQHSNIKMTMDME